MTLRTPILMYHSIDEDASPLSTAPALFARQMESLRRAGWRTARIAEIGAAIRARRALPRRTLAITFDDAYRNFAEHAWPALRANGLGATLFAISEQLGGRSDWPGAPVALPLLSADEVRRLAAEGVEIGGHSATHARLPGLPPERLASETAGCCRALEAVIGGPVGAFAYPYGAYDAAARAAVGVACAAACTTRMGFAGPASDPLELERIDAYYLRDPRLMERLDSPATRAYLSLRAVVRRARNRYG
jgi:peptidoglycan/xylan/chitin deacetylase (PgdA/CDA1 family)